MTVGGRLSRPGGIRLNMTRLTPTLAVVCALASLVQAAPDEKAILSALGSPEFAVRDAMFTRLLSDNKLSDDVIDRAFAGATKPEQRHRLMEVAQHHLIRRMCKNMPLPNEQGSLGIMLAGSAISIPDESGKPQPGAYVMQTLPGFPAFAHLRSGDVIISLGKGRLSTEVIPATFLKSFQEQIKSFKAGQTIPMEVWRDGKIINISFAAASFDHLTIVYPNVQSEVFKPLNQEYERIWKERATQLRALNPDPKPLAVPIKDLTLH